MMKSRPAHLLDLSRSRSRDSPKSRTELQITVEKSVGDLDRRWMELKLTGKSIVGRSQHIAALHDNW